MNSLPSCSIQSVLGENVASTGGITLPPTNRQIDIGLGLIRAGKHMINPCAARRVYVVWSQSWSVVRGSLLPVYHGGGPPRVNVCTVGSLRVKPEYIRLELSVVANIVNLTDVLLSLSQISIIINRTCSTPLSLL